MSERLTAERLAAIREYDANLDWNGWITVSQRHRRELLAELDAVTRERDEANRQAALAFQAGIHHQERANTAERERDELRIERDRYARALRAVVAHLRIDEPIVAWAAADNALERPKLFDMMKFEGVTGGEL